MHTDSNVPAALSSTKLTTEAIGFGNAWFATVPQELGVTTGEKNQANAYKEISKVIYQKQWLGGGFKDFWTSYQTTRSFFAIIQDHLLPRL